MTIVFSKTKEKSAEGSEMEETVMPLGYIPEAHRRF